MNLISLALVLTAGIQTSPSQDLIDFQQIRIGEFKKIQNIRDQILTQNPKADPSMLMTNAQIRDMGLSLQNYKGALQEALDYRFDLGSMPDFHPVDFKSDDPVLTYSVARFPEGGKPKMTTLKAGLAGQQLVIYRVKATVKPKAEAGKPAPEPQSYFQYVGPFTQDDVGHQLKAFKDQQKKAKDQTVDVELVDGQQIPVTLYDNKLGQLALVLDRAPDQPLSFPEHPQLHIFLDAPEKVQSVLDGTNTSYQPMPARVFQAVKTGDGIQDFEHIRRAKYMEVQKLSDDLKAKHPTTADFPPELLQAPQLKDWGIVDQNLLFQALSFHPEGATLHGFRPIDWSKDRAAQYVTVSLGAGSSPTALTLKDAYEGKQVEIVKLKLTMPPPANKPLHNDITQVPYDGPITPDYIDAVRKQAPAKAKIEEIKSGDIPLDVYTNDSGALAFVMRNVPSQPLLLPARPMLPIFTDPLAKIRALMNQPNPTEQPHQATDLAFAIIKS